MTPGQKIIDGLRDAVKGDLIRVTIDGVTYVRADADSPEDLLAKARGKIAELIERVDVLEAALRIVDADVRHNLRSDQIGPSLLRPHAVRAVRDALE